ncbi:DUF1254 domain-containing protein [Cellulomonas pakistanensis]|uniref:Lipoprotein n=1 Tax=Cellulomonas pakistanensis TaxID=992287 RepID=A0A919PE03_9CELL|nr:DUF1254 domain-containing protein [Cellulomonas pakistanensis]GIG37835.1 lipoprotein [Cellulomonas pakistanensis]
MPETLPAPVPAVPRDPEVVRAAAEAAVWAHPALLGYRELRTEVRTGVGSFGVLHHDAGPAAPGDGTRWGDPHVLRSSAWLDLRPEPAVVGHPDLPPGLYAGLQVVDLLARTVAHLGTAATGPAAADWAVAGPGWDGRVPAGVRGVLRSASGVVRVVARTAVPTPGDLPAARALQRRFRVRPLHALGGVVPPRPAPSLAWLPWDEERAWGAGFVDYLALLLRLTRPADPGDRALLDRWARLGLLPGTDGTLDPRTRALVARGAALGAAQLEDALRRERPDPGRGAPEDAALRRAVAAVHELHAPEPEEVRAVRRRSLDGEPLEGRRRYRLVLPGPVPARLGWSLAAYAEPSGELVATPLHRAALGAGTAGLPWSGDGSLAVAVQHDAPLDVARRAGWLPVPPGPFSLVLRLYAPDAGAAAAGWAPELRAVG